MKNIIAIILIIVGLNTVQSQTGILTVDGRNYTVTGARVGVDGAAEYARGYDAGVSDGETNARSSYSFTSTPTLRVDANGDMFLLYETNLPARLNNQINEPLIRITYRNRGQFRTDDGVKIYLDPPFDVINRRSTQDIAIGLDTNPVSRNIWFDILIVDAANNIVRMNGLPITYE